MPSSFPFVGVILDWAVFLGEGKDLARGEAGRETPLVLSWLPAARAGRPRDSRQGAGATTRQGASATKSGKVAGATPAEICPSIYADQSGPNLCPERIKKLKGRNHEIPQAWPYRV